MDAAIIRAFEEFFVLLFPLICNPQFSFSCVTRVADGIVLFHLALFQIPYSPTCLHLIHVHDSIKQTPI